MKTYFESCPDCDSLNVRIVEDGMDTFSVLCYDCGCEWEDFDD